MMHVLVLDADRWWTRLQSIGLRDSYAGIMMDPPPVQPWGLRILHLSDPSGVLWHIADDRVRDRRRLSAGGCAA